MIPEAITAALLPLVLLLVATACLWHLGEELFWTPFPICLLGTGAKFASVMVGVLAGLYSAYVLWALSSWLYLTL
jgi:hypothetical protein